MAELNKTSAGVRLNGEGNPRRDPVIGEIRSRILRDNGSTVAARFSGRREGYVSGYKMNGTSQEVTDSRVNYWVDKNMTAINIRSLFGKLLKVALAILGIYLVAMFIEGYSTWGDASDALNFLEHRVRAIPIIGALYEYIKNIIIQGGY